MGFAKPTESESPPASRPTPPSWPFATTLAFAVVLAVATHCVAAWILHLNAVRAVAEVLTASMARNDAAARAGRERRPLVDPLNPNTWTLESPKDNWMAPQERARLDQARNQLVFVEIGVLVWRWVMYGISVTIALAALAGLKIRAWRRGLLLVAAASVLFATTQTVVGMRLLTVYGGFEPRPLHHYVAVAVAASAYGWLLLALATVRRNRSTRA